MGNGKWEKAIVTIRLGLFARDIEEEDSPREKAHNHGSNRHNPSEAESRDAQESREHRVHLRRTRQDRHASGKEIARGASEEEGLR